MAEKVFNLASERVRKGMTQQDLADALEVSVKTVVKWENDTTTMPGAAMVLASKLFGCSMDYLLGATEERLPK